MNGLQSIFAVAGTLLTVSTARWLGIALWIGLAFLTISLLVLTRTRWGQAKPLSKCVVLSVFAHILFAGYAYGTKLFLDQPVAEYPEQIVQLSFVDAADPSSQTQEQRPPRPWDQFALSDQVDPDVDLSLRRNQEIIEPDWQRDPLPLEPELADPPAAADLPWNEPERPLPEMPDPPVARVASAAAIEATVETPEARRQEERSPVGPASESLQRMATDDSVTEPAGLKVSAQLPSELVDAGSQLQRLTDVALTAPTADAVLDRADETVEAANRDRSNSNEGQFDIRARQPRTTSEPGQVSPEAGSAADGRSQLEALVSVVPTPVEIPRRSGDGEAVPLPYRGRNEATRSRLLQQGGGTRQTEAGVEAALAWLAANQNGDGRWPASLHGAGREQRVYGHDRQGAGANADTGITGLAVLAFLGAGHTHLEGKYRQNVQHGLEFLLRSQAHDGSLAGAARLFARMYCHAMATLALSEAYAITGDQRLEPYVRRGVQYTIRSQDPATGGWRYQPGDPGDMSQFGWQVMALKSAELAGIELPAATRAGLLRFLASASSTRRPGEASYRPGERTSRTMTAEALVCRFFLGLPRDPAVEQGAIQFLMQELPGAQKPNLYYWYYATLAIYQTQDQHWESWNEALQTQLLGRQRVDGPAAGSWDDDTVWGGYGGRVYTTSMATLSLEVYYRYLPLLDAPSR